MRRTPRKPTGVRVSAPTTLEEPATGRTLSWPERYEHVLEANNRLNARLSQLETAHRKSLTVVKYEPSLPNNDVYTKELVEENRQLLQRYRQLELRLAQTASWTSPSSRRGIGGRQDTKRWQKEHRLPIRDRATQTDEGESQRVETQEATSVDETSSLAVEEAKQEERDREVRALLTEWRARLVELETDLERLRQENELLRAESRVANEENQSQTSNRPDETTKIEQEELTHALSDRVRQLAVLEARFAHLQDKAKAKTVLYQQSVSKVEELNAALFDANQKLLKQAEWLQAHEDKQLQVDVLEKEVHLVRSENAKLNDAVATLSSRPLASWDAKLQEKSLLIAKLEAEQRELESEADKLRQDHRVITQTNDKLRERVKTLTGQLEAQAQELAKAKAESERLAMERQVAELQLRFYLSGEGGDEQFMEAVGRALKEIKAEEKGGKAASRPGNVLQEPKLDRCASCTATGSATLQKERLERISEVTKLIQEDAGAQLRSLRVTHAAEIRALKREAKQWEQRANDYLTQISALQHERSSELRQERINKTRGQSSKTQASLVPNISERLSTSRSLATFSDENVLEITILDLSLDQTLSARSSTQLVLICDYYDFESQLSPVLTLSENKVAVDFSITYKLLLDAAFARSPLAMHATIELHELQLGSSRVVATVSVSLLSLFFSSTGSASMKVKLESPGSHSAVGTLQLTQSLRRPVDHLFRAWYQNDSRLASGVPVSGGIVGVGDSAPTRVLTIRVISVLLLKTFVNANQARSLALSFRFMGYPDIRYTLAFDEGIISRGCHVIFIDRSKHFTIPIDAGFNAFLTKYELGFTIQTLPTDSTSATADALLPFSDAMAKMNQHDGYLSSLILVNRAADRVAGRVCVEVCVKDGENAQQGIKPFKSMIRSMEKIVRRVFKVHETSNIDWRKFCEVMMLSPVDRASRQLLLERISATLSCEKLLSALHNLLTGSNAIDWSSVAQLEQILKQSGWECSRTDVALLHASLLHSSNVDAKSKLSSADCRRLASKFILLCATYDADWLRIEPLLRQHVETHQLLVQHGQTPYDLDKDEIDWVTFQKRLLLLN